MSVPLRPIRRLLAAALAAALIWGAAAPARAGATMCDAAAAQAAQATGVPLDVLRAIARTETGRARNGQLEPWPWTVNVEGRGEWFDSAAAALAHARAAQARGAQSFDLGCFQLNHRWHGAAFASLEAMIDPAANALYAARFLRDLHAETGSWNAAAAAYHSRTPVHANRYLARFTRILAGLDPAGTEATAALPAPPRAEPARRLPDQPRANLFPLLIAGAGAAASPGSLMPGGAGAGGTPLFGGG